MDLSSVPEEQRQKLQQLQELFKEHQQQQLIQQQHEEEQKQREIQQQYREQYQGYAYQYDLSKSQSSYLGSTQPYDYSSQAYYQYYYQQQYDGQWQQGQAHGAYLQDYANPHYQYQQADPQPRLPQVVQAEAQLFEPVPVHPPAVLVETGVRNGVLTEGHRLNGYYQEQGILEGSGAAAYTGLSPAAAAAVAALSQLTEFAGKVGVTDIAFAGMQQGWHWQGDGRGVHGQVIGHSEPMSTPMLPLANQSSFSGGGRRGDKSIRNGKRGAVGGRHAKTAGRGRGRGRGHGLDRGQNGIGHTEDAPSSSTSAEPLTAEALAASAVIPGEAAQHAAVPHKAAPDRRPPQVLQCEICKVECNSVEILEQHKNGKKHKKNLQKIEELNKANNSLGETKNGNVEVASLQENLQLGGEETQPTPKSVSTEEAQAEAEAEAASGSRIEASDPTDAAAAAQPESTTENASKVQNKRKGAKKKQKNGQGLKRTKLEPQPRVPKIVVPLVCDVCNIKCDTQDVLNCHLAGKKHIAKVKRFEGHQATFRPLGLQALYPPGPISQNFITPQPHAQQHDIYGSQQQAYPQPVTYTVPPCDHPAAVEPAHFTQHYQALNP
ncbi:hypothetical protein Dimus_034898 [Dionaea muscipula]